jgi:hypothetical protein
LKFLNSFMLSEFRIGFKNNLVAATNLRKASVTSTGFPFLCSAN